MANPVPPSAALGELSRQRSALLHPVSVIALVILIGVFALIAAAVLDWDKGKVLVRLSEREFARGLITYVFAIGTVGIAVVLVVAVLVGGEEMKERFNLGKEVLSLLLGIFGTIVGFYYGSELSAAVGGRPNRPGGRPPL
jgi:drug/metabolite transporter (DMT)-like permease